jgi:hypothetical protein
MNFGVGCQADMRNARPARGVRRFWSQIVAKGISTGPTVDYKATTASFRSHPGRRLYVFGRELRTARSQRTAMTELATFGRRRGCRRTHASVCEQTRSSPSITTSGSAVPRLRGDSGPAARADHRIDTRAGDLARTLLCDDQLPHSGIERSDRTSTETYT